MNIFSSIWYNTHVERTVKGDRRPYEQKVRYSYLFAIGVTVAIQILSVLLETYFGYTHYLQYRYASTSGVPVFLKELVESYVVLIVLLALWSGIEYATRARYFKAVALYIDTCVICVNDSGKPYTEKQGEVAYTDYIFYGFMRLLLIAISAGSAYYLTYQNAPVAKVKDVKVETSSIQAHITQIEKSIEAENKRIDDLRKETASIVNDSRSYAEWEGQRVMIMENRTRIIQINQQVATAQASVANMRGDLQKAIASLNDKEVKVENHNKIEKQVTQEKNHGYASIFCFFWIIFEVILLGLFNYIKSVMMQFKVERFTNNPISVYETRTVRTAQNTHGVVESKKRADKPSRSSTIGFDIGKRGSHVPPPTPEKVHTHTVSEVVKDEGFNRTCPYCGNHFVSYNSKTKYCSNEHRMLFNNTKNLTYEQKLAMWEKAGYDKSEFKISKHKS